MKVLLTGGTGFIGSKLREDLKRDGHQVRLLVRPESEHKMASATSFEIVYGDIFNTNACLRAADGCDTVIHLVGIVREFPSRGIIFDQFHRVATQNIVDAARRMGVSRFIHMSALGASAEAKSTYHRTKFAGEKEVENSSMRWTIFRPSWVFAPKDRLIERFVRLVGMPIIPLINGGKARMQPVARDDVTLCVSRALTMPETQQQTYEVAGPDRISFRDVVQAVATKLERKTRTMNVPGWAMQPVAKLLQRFPSFPLTTDQIRMLSEDNVCEIDRYVKTFRVEPKSFVKALPGLLE